MIDKTVLMSRLQGVKIVILDVDGVLTNGDIILSNEDEGKSYNALDGHGIRLLQRHGVRVAIITGRRSRSVERRAAELDIVDLVQEAKFKLPAYYKLLSRLGLNPEEVVYVGDDLPDIPPMRHSAVGVAVATAHEEVYDRADWVTQKPGGRGAVREVADLILKAQGKWDDVMRRYLIDEIAMAGEQ